MKNKEIKPVADNQSAKKSTLKRRSFITVLGGGIFIFLRPWGAIDLLGAKPAEDRSLSKDYNAFLHIAEDGTVTCFTGKIEMGQGIITSLAQMMADEMNVPFEKVKMVMGDTDLCPYDQGTWGSLSTREFGPHMWAAAAEAMARRVKRDMVCIPQKVFKLAAINRKQPEEGTVCEAA